MSSLGVIQDITNLLTHQNKKLWVMLCLYFLLKMLEHLHLLYVTASH